MAKVMGGIFLIVGIAIGAGILALPVAVSKAGFWPAAGMMLLCWLVMTFNALLMLEVNLWLPADSNIISMAQATLGRAGQAIAWLCYCLLYYALLAAYIAAGADVFAGLLAYLHAIVPNWFAVLGFSGLLGAVVYQGTQTIDYFNRALIILKLSTFALLLFLLLGYVKPINLAVWHVAEIPHSLMVMVTSFGFATLVPSLRSYFSGNVVQLRRVILVGSVIPLLCYLIWNLTILGVVPLTGNYGFFAILHSGKVTSNLINSLYALTQSRWAISFAALFGAICVSTSFLGVSLSLSDFLADGCGLSKHGKAGLLVFGLTFLPPVGLVLFYPNIFIAALQYAGTVCCVLLVLFPVLMAWSGRYRKQLATGYQVLGGKGLLIFDFIIAVVLIVLGVWQEFIT